MYSVEIIKSQHTKLGTITIEKHTDDGHIEYHVVHSNEGISNSWHNDKREAILRFQFLAGKY